ncbi:hypothetical protein KAR91_45845 [Candidatus Pacearchaeota archaeon]|nr:hypothetical protein [Candidatus Pacearchaeota archaeon]
MKKEDRELLKSAIEASKHKPQPAAAKPTKEISSHPEDITTHALNCPNCYPKVKAAVIKKEFGTKKPYECEECGLPVGEEGIKEEWNCPGCDTGIVKERD